MSVALLVVTNVVALIVGILVGLILATVGMNISQALQDQETAMAQDQPRKRRIRVTDVLLTVLTVGFIVSSFAAIQSNERSASADERSADTVQCLETYANALADALDRRNNDNAKLQEVDARRDEIVERLLTAPDDQKPALRVTLFEATRDKRAALRDVQNGRAEKSYPNAPREACKDE